MAQVQTPKPHKTELHTTEQLMMFFMKLDKNNDGVVDRKELLDFCQNNKVPQSAVSEWMSRFDTDNDGKITLNEYCRGLGLKREDVIKEKTEVRNQQERQDFGEVLTFPDIEVLHTSMTWAKQEDIVNKYKELVGSGEPTEEKMNQVVDGLQNYMNDKYGKVWQCVILTGSFWMRFSYEPFMSIQFRHKNKFVVLAWRTNRT
ncbi:Tegument antigen [Clonorchis sinensis]|uniref:Tegument antigen n=2 Tax=Clonorchis sinensis TaxID=79923 RepID=A0A8T1MJW6_CLOSI|nr:Tegument antigen [Clonorchis sinensis]GAA37705.1 tegument antigen [Clonorchis sinensis]